MELQDFGRRVFFEEKPCAVCKGDNSIQRVESIRWITRADPETIVE